MTKTILPETPAHSPELPITLHVDGNLDAVDFISRLHRGGLELRNAEDGSYAVVVLAERPPQPERGIRVQLFEASGIVYATRIALASGSEVDEDQLADALAAADRIINAVAAALEGHDHG